MWGLDELEVLLAHYGEPKETDHGLHDPLVNADQVRGEFLMFKPLVDQHRREERDGQQHVNRQKGSSLRCLGVQIGPTNKSSEVIHVINSIWWK